MKPRPKITDYVPATTALTMWMALSYGIGLGLLLRMLIAAYNADMMVRSLGGAK